MFDFDNKSRTGFREIDTESRSGTVKVPNAEKSLEAMADEVVETVRGSTAIKFAVLALKSRILKRLNEEGMTVDELREVLQRSSSRVIDTVLKILDIKNRHWLLDIGFCQREGFVLLKDTAVK